MNTEMEPFSSPQIRRPRLSLPALAILLVFFSGMAAYVFKSRVKTRPAAAAPPSLIVPAGQRLDAKKPTPRPAAPRPAAAAAVAAAGPAAARERLARAQGLAEQIHELSRQATEAQVQETGNAALIRRLEAFHRSAGNLRSAYRAAGGPALDAKSLRAQVEILVLESSDIERRASSLGPAAAGHWQALGRCLRELRSLA